MEFSIASLLASFTSEKSLTPKVLEQKLGTREGRGNRQLQIALDALEKLGILNKERGRYRRLEQEGMFEAKLRCSSKGFCFAIQDDDDAEDVYVRECHLNHAWNGDRVLVKVIKEGGGRSRRRSPEGHVELVLDRANSSLLARVEKGEDGIFRAAPLDDRLLFRVELDTSGVDLDAIVNYLVSVEIVRYPIGQLPPLGRVIKVLGADADAAAPADIVVCKYGLHESFPEEVLAAAAALPAPADSLKASAIQGRLDLRSLLTVATVTATAGELPPVIDRAITLETNPAGHMRLGLHVPDVAHYVEPDSPLDREARRRGVAADLGAQWLPLFPADLYARHGSLGLGCDRLATSVLLTFNDQGELLEFEIHPSVVRADATLTEAQLDAFLDGNQADPELPQAPAIGDLLTQLKTLAAALRGQRLSRGGFDLSGYRGLTSFDREDVPGAPIAPIGIAPTARVLLAEVTIAANAVVASHLQALQVPTLYRVQAAPSPGDVQETLRLAGNLGLELTLEQPDQVTPRDVQQWLQQATDGDTRKILNRLLVEALKPAAYSHEPRSHFGLALPVYTTLNAPTRHYGDLLVQRSLNTLFAKGRDRRTARSKEGVNLHHSSCHGAIGWNLLPTEDQQELEASITSAAWLLSDRERLIQEAAADSHGLRKTAAMRARIGETFSGPIVGVQSYGFFVELEALGIEGLVHVSSLKDDWYEYRSRQQMLIGRKSRRQYALGGRVEVEVRGVDYYRQQIDLVAVSGGAESNFDALVDDEDEADDSDLTFSYGAEEPEESDLVDLREPDDLEAPLDEFDDD
ncbi:VacB/RNase II family 3'-5' exoribonuclease [Limnothrix sp. FACHB-881]|uniref:ribonuclease R family protein n=1 Tax=Limnothrix sp. FACHB-881 TaxID=2692819 RepID=UPI0016858062|nr:ribonuclease R family protein [Limnothrix sp. FACHB-881]MBD2634749.1 VacB/RNase II family 3'-5' exoribonuclease [Limnothrix sp. FACHB-881]